MWTSGRIGETDAVRGVFLPWACVQERALQVELEQGSWGSLLPSLKAELPGEWQWLLVPWPGQRGSVTVAIYSEAFPPGTSSLSEIACSMKCYFPVPSAQFTSFFLQAP